MTFTATGQRDRRFLRITAGGRVWRIECGTDMESLWESMDDSRPGAEDRIPYWAEIWPSGLALCNLIFERARELSGARVLDVGCGLGLTALAASHCGARVAAMDLSREALVHARSSAGVNGVAQPLWLCMDWRAPAIRPASVDIVIGGDVVYEKRFFDPLEKLFSSVLSPAGRVWLAEPGRSVSADVTERFAARGWRVAKLGSQFVDTGSARADVSLIQLKRGM